MGPQGAQGPAGPGTIIDATDNTTDTSLFPVMVTATGAQNPRISQSKLAFNASTGLLTLTAISVTGSTTLGDATGDTINCRGRFSNSVIPSANNTYDLGSSTLVWRNIYTGDLNMSNMDGDPNEVDGSHGKWTIQEGEDDLFVINRTSGKKYKFKLEEVQ